MKELSTEIQENDFTFLHAAYWRHRAGNGYKRRNDSDADVTPTHEGGDSQQYD
jgi:hypothetical protein